MARKSKTRGLIWVGSCWHIDKWICQVRICESTGTSDEVEATLYLAKRIEETRQQQMFGHRPRRRWRVAATRYLNDFAHLKAIRRAAEALADLDPFIGDMWLDEVNWDTLEAYRKARAHLADATVIRNLSVVRRITHLAARLWRDKATNQTWLATAPLLPLGRPKKKRAAYPMDWDEQRLLFSELAEHLQEMALFKVNTGTRDEDVCGLLWIWENKVPGVGSVFVIPGDKVKNADSRVIVCNDVAQSVIEAQRGRHSTHVFCYTPPPASTQRFRLQRRMREQGLTDARKLRMRFEARPVEEMGSSGWNHARRRAAARYEKELGRECPLGFRRVRVHDLKHTYGRRLRAAGVSFEDRQDLLGHKSSRVTTDYSQAEIANLKRLSNLVNEKRGSSVTLRVVGQD